MIQGLHAYFHFVFQRLGSCPPLGFLTGARVVGPTLCRRGRAFVVAPFEDPCHPIMRHLTEIVMKLIFFSGRHVRDFTTLTVFENSASAFGLEEGIPLPPPLWAD